MIGAALSRGGCYLLLWLMLAGAHWADLPAAACAVVAATWVSLRLLPPGATRLSVWGIAVLALRFPVQSVLAGVEVAWRALQPELKLRPGFVLFQPQVPQGVARDVFCMLTSLLPGTVPSGADHAGALVIHCLDVGQPVAARLAREEGRFLRALGWSGHA